MPLTLSTPRCVAALVLTSLIFAVSGCQQPGGAGTAAAPITTLPGQPAGAAGPSLSTLNPLSAAGAFGSGVRVPPPATGSYGNPGGVIATPGYAPQSYAPPNQVAPGGVAPMSYSSSVNAGATTDRAVAASSSGVEQAGWQDSSVQPAGWRETGAAAPLAANGPAGAAGSIGSTQPGSGEPATSSDVWRSGGMGVIDLTHAPPPPGYHPAPSESSNPLPYRSPPTAIPGQMQPSPLSAPQSTVAPLIPQQPGALQAVGDAPMAAGSSSGWTSVPPTAIRGF